MGLILGGASASDLILDGKSVSLYVGGSPPMRVWPTTDVVQITLGTLHEARDQFRAALTARGLDYTTVTEIPFDIELVGTGSINSMFNNCYALTTVPAMDTSQVTNMAYMFSYCSSLVSVPDMDTAQVTYMDYMFNGCASLTDGNVHLIGRHPNVNTTGMINNSGLTYQPFVETVQITLGTGYEARDQFRAALTARGLAYNTVTKIPFDIELVGTGVADHMFDYCGMLTAVPALNTSGVTSMRYMFRDCKNLKEAPAMDTSNVTDMTQMFYKCSSMTYVPDMHTSQARVMGHMLFGCSALTDGNVRLIGKHPQVNTNLMIYNSGLTRMPFYDTSGNPI